MSLPPAHPLRQALNDEVHARPPEALVPPARIIFLALLVDAAERAREDHHLVSLVTPFGASPPDPAANHYRADLGPFSVKRERHGEFTRYKLILPGVGEDVFDGQGLQHLPPGWLERLPGRLLVATRAAIVAAEADLHDHEELSSRCFGGNAIVGSAIGDGLGEAFTDFRIHADGFGRLLIRDFGMTPRQGGRMLQRLLEIDTYRMMALLALPLAQELGPALTEAERELAGITEALTAAGPEEEPMLLDRLTRLDAAIERRITASQFRFSAAAAYDELVHRRVDELREGRISGLQTFREFTDRRLAPAMRTCRSVARRQEALSERVARASTLLATRVDITHERQIQAVLGAMDRRAGLQLRLQETVEGLSVAAITYYVAGLIGYALKGLKAGGLPLNVELLTGLSIPIVALLVAWGLHRVRRTITRGARGA